MHYLTTDEEESDQPLENKPAQQNRQQENRVTSKEYPREINATLMVDSHPVKFLIDSGATCNVVRLRDLSGSDAGGKTIEKIQPTTAALRTYDHSQLKPLGKCEVEIVNPKRPDDGV